MKPNALKIKVITSGGRIYFSKRTERRILFFMTLAMLGAGVVTRLV
ncbi:MAG: hypothetical protein HUN04_01840 [Desulfobacter sp.]|nr:MAG: hypothetical protein HUN04_01840 [Desulfobacter sp.]